MGKCARSAKKEIRNLAFSYMKDMVAGALQAGGYEY